MVNNRDSFLPDSSVSEHVEPCTGTLWKMREGAISAPFSVFRRNMGQEDALRRKPEEDLCNKHFIIDSDKISLDRKSKI